MEEEQVEAVYNDTFKNYLKLNVSEKIFYYDRFPLLPVLNYRKENDYNVSQITFRWLFIYFWTLEHLSFEIALVMDSHWGIAINFLFPYLRLSIGIPLPEFISDFTRKYLHRKTRKGL